MSVAVILGSAFDHPLVDTSHVGGGATGLSEGSVAAWRSLEPRDVDTPFGNVTLWRFGRPDRPAWVIFRHGAPRHYLPHQIPHRAHAWALRSLGCRSLLVTSSVGVLDARLPLDAPLLMSDLMMPDNRLPDGSICTMYPEPVTEQGRLVLDEGLISQALSDQIGALAQRAGQPIAGRALFAYACGPRSKTLAENAMWARLGAQVSSMTVGPEIVLANELEIACAGLLIGHKYSAAGARDRVDHRSIQHALAIGRLAFETLVLAFLEQGHPVPFGNRIHCHDRDFTRH